MSHAIESDPARKREHGEPTLRHLGALQRAAESMGLRVNYVENYRMGMNRETHQNVVVTGWAIQFPKWNKKFVVGKLAADVPSGTEVDLADEDVKEYFDNWPIYGPTHQAVQSGEKRVGERGRWGDIQHLWNLYEAYKRAANAIIHEQIAAEAKQKGESCIVESQEENKIVLLIDSGTKSTAAAGASLDNPNPELK